MNIRRTVTALALGLALFPALAACGDATDEVADDPISSGDAVEAPGDAVVVEAPTDAVKVDPPTVAQPAVAPELPVIGSAVVTTTTGLRYEDVVVGDGTEAMAGKPVSVQYAGFLEDGTLFDTSVGGAPLEFMLGTSVVIAGWDEGIAGMKVGGRRTLIIPPDLAYGASGAAPLIPPDATLVFDVELLNAGE